MPDPYYQDEQATLYHGDCFEVLPELQRESVHLLLTDPPYGQAFQSNRRQQKLDTIHGDDGSLDVTVALALACKVLRRGRHAYVFGPPEAIGAPLTATVPLVWDKMVNGTGDLSLPWSESHEHITFCVYEPSKANREKATATSPHGSVRAR
jgi:site-specific DNA-methyltransferase (adenine-specific)